jgi:hypothetical protein
MIAAVGGLSGVIGFSAVPLCLIGFAAIARVKGGRALSGGAVATLTVLAIAWLVGAYVIWNSPAETKLRFGELAGDRAAIDAVLAVACVGVLCLAAALRSFSLERLQRGWKFAGAAFAAFVGWSAVVRYGAGIGVLLGVVALIALSLASSPLPRLRPEVGALSATRPTAGRRISAIVATTAFDLMWLGLAWLARIAANSDTRVACNCWQDYAESWQWGAEMWVALGGSACLAVTTGLYLRGMRRWASVTGAVSILAIAAWIAFWIRW